MNEAIKKYSSVLSDLALSADPKHAEQVCEAFAKQLHAEGLSLQAGLIIEKAMEQALHAIEKRRAVVRSATPLAQSLRQRIKEQVEKKLGHEALLEEVVDPTLIAGWVVDFAGMKIDGSLSGRINKLAKHLK